MVELERDIWINGHHWIRVPENSTEPREVYPERRVRECGGDPNIVRGPVASSDD